MCIVGAAKARQIPATSQRPDGETGLSKLLGEGGGARGPVEEVLFMFVLLGCVLFQLRNLTVKYCDRCEVVVAEGHGSSFGTRWSSQSTAVITHWK